jgi:hypothetical protein
LSLLTDDKIEDLMRIIDAYVTESNNPIKALTLPTTEKTRLYKVSRYFYAQGLRRGTKGIAVLTHKEIEKLFNLGIDSAISYLNLIK